jgi:hypothetical protein
MGGAARSSLAAHFDPSAAKSEMHPADVFRRRDVRQSDRIHAATVQTTFVRQKLQRNGFIERRITVRGLQLLRISTATRLPSAVPSAGLTQNRHRACSSQVRGMPKMNCGP